MAFKGSKTTKKSRDKQITEDKQDEEGDEDDDFGDECWDVKQIVGKRGIGDGAEYLVQWEPRCTSE